MKYDNIIKYFQSEETIIGLLQDIKEMFDVIDDYSSQFISDILSPDELRETKTKLTGIVSTLEPIYSKALSLKKQIEYRYCVEHKDDGSAASVEKASKAFVKSYRDVRDVLRGYLNAANGLIFDCKDRIEANRKEYNRTKEEN